MLIKQGKTNIKYLLIVVVLAAIVGGGILWFTAEKGVLPTQLPAIKKPEEKLMGPIPRYSELFKTCLDKSDELYKEEEPNKLKEWYGLKNEMSPREIEKAIKKFTRSMESIATGKPLEEIKDEDIEEIIMNWEIGLDRGILLGEQPQYETTIMCRNFFMDEKLRSSEYNEVCKVNPKCCNLPRAENPTLAKELVETMYECALPLPLDSIGEAKKLKYGYLVESEVFEPGLYLTDSGCLINCAWFGGPYALEALEEATEKMKKE